MTSGIPGLDHSGKKIKVSIHISPEMSVSAFAELSRIQDKVGTLVRHVKVLDRVLPAGSGYAAEVGGFMSEYAVKDKGSALKSLTSYGQELEELKQQIQTGLDKLNKQDKDAAKQVGDAGGC